MGKSRRVAIVAGVRTPFAKQGTALSGLSALELGVKVTAELLRRTSVAPAGIEQVVFGQVIQSPGLHNIAREISLEAGLSPTVDAFTVSRACASGYQAVVSVAEAILAGTIGCGVAGGAESTSHVALALEPRVSAALQRSGRARSVAGRLTALASLRARDLIPSPPPLTERSTGLTMGESAEKMAQENGISRLDQDRYAHQSHVRAAAAWDDGRLADEVMSLYLPTGGPIVERDGSVRADSNLDSYARLPPVFDSRHGTVTAGNSSPLSDGAAALLLMREDLARDAGAPVLATLRSYAFTGLDPADQLLLGSAYAIPLALSRAGIAFADLDLVDMHEAFAAQVLSSVRAIESERFAREKLGRSKLVGKIDWDRFNVLGGSLAMGHPFAATGIRQIVQTANQLGRSGGELALCTTCAAGGLGAALILEAA
jgi:acetyl-CoA acyltransferase